jgi:hypothetical protein
MPTTTVAAAADAAERCFPADLPCHALMRQSRARSPGMAAPTHMGWPSARALAAAAAAAELPRDAAAAPPSTSTSLQQQKVTQRTMGKLLRKLQNDKQR